MMVGSWPMATMGGRRHSHKSRAATVHPSCGATGLRLAEAVGSAARTLGPTWGSTHCSSWSSPGFDERRCDRAAWARLRAMMSRCCPGTMRNFRWVTRARSCCTRTDTLEGAHRSAAPRRRRRSGAAAVVAFASRVGLGRPSIWGSIPAAPIAFMFDLGDSRKARSCGAAKLLCLCHD